jgi:hypothetical protein
MTSCKQATSTNRRIDTAVILCAVLVRLAFAVVQLLGDFDFHIIVRDSSASRPLSGAYDEQF